MKQHRFIHRRKSGQAIIFLLMAMVIGLLIVIWNLDLHTVVKTKLRVNNAGDAGALAAARWQATSLNMIGELNLIQAAYICDNMDLTPASYNQVRGEVDQLAELRNRLSLNGPLLGYAAAQRASDQNLNARDIPFSNNEQQQYMKERANRFLTCGAFFEGVVEEPYSGAWQEYGALLMSIAENSVTVDCVGTQYFMAYARGHILFSPGFYEAVAGEQWCWFYFNARNLLREYTDYTYWDGLPAITPRISVNSEYLSLGLTEWDTWLIDSVVDYQTNHVESYYGSASRPTNEIQQEFYEFLVSPEGEPVDGVDTNGMEVKLGQDRPFFVATGENVLFRWHFYSPNYWLGGETLHARGANLFDNGLSVKEHYDYRGADATVQCHVSADNLIMGNLTREEDTTRMAMVADSIYWQASAKPFGYLEVASEQKSPVWFGLVLPAYRDVRLIHNKLSRYGDWGAIVPGYDVHIYKHLPVYIQEGPEGIKDFDCWYCRQLEIMENEGFRSKGANWLDNSGHTCKQTPSSSSG